MKASKKNYFRKQWLKDSLIWGRKEMSRSRKPRNLKFPNKRNPKRYTSGHIIIKMVKVKHKERILKAAREKKLVIYKGNPI